MAHFSIDTSFSMSGSATRTIPVYLDNIVPISVFEMTLKDMPDGLIVTSVNPVGRFLDVGGLFLDNTGEDEDGNCFIFGYTVGTSISSGSGPIFELVVQRKNYFGGQLGLMFGDLSARDENTNEVTVCGTGYAMLSVALELTDSTPLKIGDSADMQIYHDGSNTRLHDTGTGNFLIQSNGSGIYLQKDASESLATFLTTYLYRRRSSAIDNSGENSKSISHCPPVATS